MFLPDRRAAVVMELLVDDELDGGGHHGLDRLDEVLHLGGHARLKAAQALVEHHVADTCAQVPNSVSAASLHT